MMSACARQAATKAASSGCVASQAFTASCRSTGNSPSTKACNSSGVTGVLSTVIVSPFSFHAAQRRALAVEIGFDLGARPREPRHHRSDRNGLYFGHFAIRKSLQHHEQQRMALILDQHRK